MTYLEPYLGPFDPLRMAGLLGFCIYVTNYCCLSFRILHSESIRFFALNTVAAMLVMSSLMRDFNLASALIQTFWIVIGSCAIFLRLKSRRQAKTHFAVGQQDHPIVPLHVLHPRPRRGTMAMFTNRIAGDDTVPFGISSAPGHADPDQPSLHDRKAVGQSWS